jgi:hypothetical protein
MPHGQICFSYSSLLEELLNCLGSRVLWGIGDGEKLCLRLLRSAFWKTLPRGLKKLINDCYTRKHYLVLYEPQAGSAKKLDKFCVKLIICVPWTTRQLYRRVKMSKHVNLACLVLEQCEYY